MAEVLRVKSPDTGEEVLRVSRTGGVVRAEHVDPLLAPDWERWLARGLVELERAPDRGLIQRITPSDAPDFLERLARTLNGEFGFVTDLSRGASAA